MINTVKITNHLGELLTIDMRSPETSGFFIRGIEGLGPPKAILNMRESVGSDGSFFNSARAESRNIVMDLGFYDNYNLTIEQLRQQSYRFFPLKQLITIEIETSDRNAVTTGYVESNEPNIFSKEAGTQVSILCPSSYFSDGNITQTYFSGTSALFEFPFENPSLSTPLIEFGSVFINTQASVFYTGETQTGVTIVINFLGPVTNPTISNASNGQNMAISSSKVTTITGSNFVAGDIVIISTLRGDKYISLIRGGQVYNILNALDVLSDWFTIDRGDNVFTYTASAGLANLQFYIEHYALYGGV